VPKEKFYVRGLNYIDKEEILALDEQSYNDISVYGDIYNRLLEDEGEDTEESVYYFGAFLDDKLIGYCTIGGADEYYDEGSLLSDVFIDENYRSKGYGTKMCEAIIKKHGEYPVYIDVLDNQDYFYKKMGFKSIGNGSLMMPLPKTKCIDKER